jgi:hypothetical protein
VRSADTVHLLTLFTMEGDCNTLPSTASVKADQNKRQSLTNGRRLLQPTPLRNFGLCTLSAPYTATTQTSSHTQKIPFSKPSCQTALRSLKQADTSTFPYNIALTMADTPMHPPTKRIQRGITDKDADPKKFAQNQQTIRRHTYLTKCHLRFSRERRYP